MFPLTEFAGYADIKASPEVNSIAIKVKVRTGVTPTTRTLPHLIKIVIIASKVKMMPALSQIVIVTLQ